MCYRCDACNVLVTVPAVQVIVEYHDEYGDPYKRGHRICPGCNLKMTTAEADEAKAGVTCYPSLASQAFHTIRAAYEIALAQQNEGYLLRHRQKIANDRLFSNKIQTAKRMGTPDPFKPLAAVGPLARFTRPTPAKAAEPKVKKSRKQELKILPKPPKAKR